MFSTIHCRIVDHNRIFIEIEGHGVRGVSLELEGMGTGLCRRLDDSQGTPERLVMVAEQLGDDKWWKLAANLSLSLIHI